MTRERNTEATCGNCPYWSGEKSQGACKKAAPGPALRFVDNPGSIINPSWAVTNKDNWCGQHPDFWKNQTESKTINNLLSDLRKRHDALLARLDGMAEKVKSLPVHFHPEAFYVTRTDVLDILEGRK